MVSPRFSPLQDGASDPIATPPTVARGSTRDRVSEAVTVRGRTHLRGDADRYGGASGNASSEKKTSATISRAHATFMTRALLLGVGIPGSNERDRRGSAVQHRVDQEASGSPVSLIVQTGPVLRVSGSYPTIEFGHRPSTKFTVTVTTTATGSPFNRAGVYFH